MGHPKDMSRIARAALIVGVFGDAGVGKKTFIEGAGFVRWKPASETEGTQHYERAFALADGDLFLVRVRVYDANVFENKDSAWRTETSDLDGAVVMYDQSSVSSFRAVRYWMAEARRRRKAT